MLGLRFVIVVTFLSQCIFGALLTENDTRISDKRKRRQVLIKRTVDIVDQAKLKAEKHKKAITEGMIPRTTAQNVIGTFDSLFCPVCHTTVNGLLPFIDHDWGVESFIWSLKHLCITFHIFDDYICTGTIDSFKSEFVEIIRNYRPDARSICHMGVNECFPDYDIFKVYQWKNITFPQQINDNSYRFPTDKNRKTLKVLHITDVHIDEHYEEKTDSECTQPLCCRKVSDGVKNSEKSHYWGTRRSCDIPFRTFEATMEAAKRKLPNPDLIFWTGDAPAHDIWAYSKEKTNFFVRNVTDYFLQYYPNSIILPAIGNHEGVPVNQFEVGSNWLYEEIAEQWAKFNLHPDSFETIKRYGYYTELLRPGFRIVSINSNFCNDENFWILTANGDPGHQHRWLIETLQNAENTGEAVLLLGHIPPGELDTIEFCSKFFYQIVTRYSDTIRAQFYGHTHWDHMRLFYEDYDKNKPVNVAYVTPSVTTWIGMDPSFRIYEIDHWDNNDSTFAVLDHHTFTADVEIPKSENLKFKKEYSAKSEYRLNDLSVKSWANLISQWERGENLRLLQRYYLNKYHHNLNEECDSKCTINTICFIKSAAKDDHLYKTLCSTEL